MNHEPLKKKAPLLRQALLFGSILATGMFIGGYIIQPKNPNETIHSGTNKNGGDSSISSRDNATEQDKGPHGGWLFTDGNYFLEFVIKENGEKPHFRIYTHQDKKMTDPGLTQAAVVLERLGGHRQVFSFVKENDYLKSEQAVEEPHSFKVIITAQSGGKTHTFNFETAEGRVSLSDAQLKSNGIKIAAAGPKRIKTLLQTIGEVRLNEDHTVRVVPRLTGIVESVAANAGDRVRKGQVLAVVSSQALADQRGEYLASQKRLEFARCAHEREKSLWERKISSEQDYQLALKALQEAEIAEQSAKQKLTSLGAGLQISGDLTRYEIRSPLDGVITEKNIVAGGFVKDDVNIFVVADLSSVWVDITVYAKDIVSVRAGQTAVVKTSAFDAETTGTITFVGAVVGEQTRTAKSRIVLPNPQGIWRPGLPVIVNLVTDDINVPVAIAADAIQTLGEAQVVFFRYGDQFEARPITTGRSDGKAVEVLSGLAPGDQYAAGNSYLIKAEIGKAGATHEH